MIVLTTAKNKNNKNWTAETNIDFLLFVFYAVLSVPYSLVVICWERADPLAVLFAMFSCVFVT